MDTETPTLADVVAGILPIEGGWRVKTTEWCHVDVLVMMGGNHRLVETDLKYPVQYERGWCYRGPAARTTALLAAMVWDGRPDTEPEGWIKEVKSNRCRRDGDPEQETIGWQPGPPAPLTLDGGTT